MDGFDHALRPEAAHDEGPFVHSFWALVGLPDHDGREIQDRGFLRNRSAVGDDTEGMHLQFDVIQESKGLQEVNATGPLFLSGSCQSFLCPGMG